MRRARLVPCEALGVIGLLGALSLPVLNEGIGFLPALARQPRSASLSNMKQIPVAEILELPVQERIRLVELIWESIAAIPEAIEVTPEVRAELEERLKEFEANPEAGYSWEQVKAHLRNGTWRSA